MAHEEKQAKPGKLLKKHMIDHIAKRFKGSSSLFVSDCGKLSNKQVEDLRKRLKGLSCEYMVVKNSMCIQAFQKLKIEGLDSFIKGTCGISFGGNDPVLVSKILIDFAKENDKFQLKGAYVDGKVFADDVVKKLASMPSKDVLITRLVSILNSPISGMVIALSGITKQYVYVINAIKEQKEKQGGK